MAQGAVLITYHEVFSKEPSIGDLYILLAKYQRPEVLVFLAKLNCLLRTWQNQPDFNLDSRLSRLVFPSYDAKIERIRRDSVERVLFSRLTILYLIKQACLASPLQGTPVNNPTAVEEIGVCCLMANDLVLTNIPAPSDTTLQRLTSLLPFCDYVSHEEYPLDIARTLIMFEEVAKVPKLKKSGDFIDLESLFETHMGLSPQEFCDLVFGASTRYLNLKMEELETSPDALFLRPEFFRKTKIPPDSVRQFFAKVAIREEEFASQVSETRDRPGDDLTIIQRYPLIEPIQDRYFCLDPGFLVDKAGKGLYWSLFSEIRDGTERSNLASFWGVVFEEYVNWILGAGYSAGGRFIPSPKFPNADQAFDACLVEGSALVVFEHKSSVLRADAKYGGDPNKLQEELRKKFIEGDEEGAKGLAQLERSIRRFLGGETIEGVSANNVREIYPVLVCLDRSLLNPYMNQYLAKNFAGYSLRKTYKKTVTPIFTVGISELERLLPYLQEFRVSDIIESYYRANRKMLFSISASEVPLLKEAKRGKDPVGEKFSRFATEMQARLFGEEQNIGERAV